MEFYYFSKKAFFIEKEKLDDEIKNLSVRVNTIIAALDVKEMRWLELSE